MSHALIFDSIKHDGDYPADLLAGADKLRRIRFRAQKSRDPFTNAIVNGYECRQEDSQSKK